MTREIGVERPIATAAAWRIGMEIPRKVEVWIYLRAISRCTTNARNKQRRRTDVRTLLIRFRRDESGATAIEYGLIAAGIAAVIIAVVNTIGGSVNTAFTSISTQLK
jgi:pilus assembly protein Flp/PilA